MNEDFINIVISSTDPTDFDLQLNVTFGSEDNIDDITIEDEKLSVIAGERGPQGLRGLPGKDAETTISTDPDNRATGGSDGGIFVPQFEGTDPLAYYILAKS